LSGEPSASSSEETRPHNEAWRGGSRGQLPFAGLCERVQDRRGSAAILGNLAAALDILSDWPRPESPPTLQLDPFIPAIEKMKYAVAHSTA
jgi:hypothetical protein